MDFKRQNFWMVLEESLWAFKHPLCTILMALNLFIKSFTYRHDLHKIEKKDCVIQAELVPAF